MVQKFVTVAAWLVLCFIAYATLSSIQARPTLPIPSSFEHLAAFAVLGIFFCLAYPRHMALVCLIVLGSAVVLELSQLLIAGRHGRVQDAIEKLAGGATGILLGHAILYFQQTRRWFQN
jgi:VanZ family protein